MVQRKEDYGVASLKRKREEIVSEISETEVKLQALILQLAHMDAALRIIRPEIALPKLPPRPTVNRVTTRRGEISRPILAALHQAEGPLTVKELARAMLIARGRPAIRISEDACETVRAVLRPMIKRGEVKAAGMEGKSQTWRLARER